MSDVIRAIDLTKRYRKVAALDGLNLDIAIRSTASPGCVLEDTDPNVTTSSVVTSQKIINR